MARWLAPSRWRLSPGWLRRKAFPSLARRRRIPGRKRPGTRGRFGRARQRHFSRGHGCLGTALYHRSAVPAAAGGYFWGMVTPGGGSLRSGFRFICSQRDRARRIRRHVREVGVQVVTGQHGVRVRSNPLDGVLRASGPVRWALSRQHLKPIILLHGATVRLGQVVIDIHIDVADAVVRGLRPSQDMTTSPGFSPACTSMLSVGGGPRRVGSGPGGRDARPWPQVLSAPSGPRSWSSACFFR